MNDRTTADAPALEHLRLEHPADGVALLTLELPERRNMMSDPMTRSWVAAVEHLREVPGLRCVVVTGAGSAFCSGGDLSWLGEGGDVDRLRSRMHAFYSDWLSVRRLEVPVVAAVNGPAIGAGLALALACDLRVVAADARLGVPFTALGLHPGMATTWSLPEVAGLAVARDLLLTGRLVRGEEAVRLGLASRVVPGDQVLDEALALARDVAAQAPVATRLTTLALRDGGHADHATALRWEALAQAVTLAGDDLQEGLAAQRERRAPHFRGR
ncbi:enoyl-CoA hydratase/isomerase family protein [Thalassiella azotivora]